MSVVNDPGTRLTRYLDKPPRFIFTTRKNVRTAILRGQRRSTITAVACQWTIHWHTIFYSSFPQVHLSSEAINIQIDDHQMIESPKESKLPGRHILQSPPGVDEIRQ